MKISAIKIEMWLAELGITKTELAKRCGVSRQNISTIVLRGTCEPKTAGKLAIGLDMNVEEFVKEG